MRIVHLNPFFFPYAGGSERRIRELARRHAKAHEVHVVTSRLPGSPAHETMDGFEVHRLPSRFWFRRWWNPPVVTTRRLQATLRDLAPDILEFHYRWAPAYHRAFVSMAGRAKLCFTYHNTYGEGLGALGLASRLNDRWTRRFIRRSDAIFCVSAFIRRDLARRGFPDERLIVAPNGVDAAELRRLAAEARLPPALQGRPFLASVGRLVDLKGYEDVLEALPRIPEEVHWAVVGTGPDRGRLERVAARRGLSHRVHFLGWLEEAQKQRVLQEARLFVHPTRSEAFGLAPLEAMAVGTPVVASAVGGLPEVVGESGRLVRPGRPEELAEAVRELLSDPALRERLGRLAAARADMFNWDATARIHEATYDRLLGGKTT